MPEVAPGELLPWLPARVRRWIAPLLRVPPLRAWRIAAVFAVAASADAAQLLLGPLGWSFADEGLDLVAMVLTITLLGFHPLLLPTFMIEILPIADVLPTWTGCVALVVARRRRQERTARDRPESLEIAAGSPPQTSAAAPVTDRASR
jgi:hypothetical protein